MSKDTHKTESKPRLRTLSELSKWQPDPATLAVLKLVEELNLPSMNAAGPEQARQDMLENGKTADLDPIPVGKIENRTLPGPGGDIPIRCYYPDSNPADRFPICLYFHGGGFVIGDLDTHDNICRGLCQSAQALIVSVDYRLAPEHPYPAAVEDAIAAFDWVRNNAQAIGGDGTRISTGGDSAGGTLAAVVAQYARDLTATNAASPLKAQVLFYPVVDMFNEHPSHVEHAETFPINKEVLDWFWDHYFGEGHDPKGADRQSVWASPILAPSFSDLAPAFVLTAGLDPLRDEGAAYASKLAAAGVETLYYCATGTIHGYLRMGKLIPSVVDTLESAGGFLKHRLHAG